MHVLYTPECNGAKQGSQHNHVSVDATEPRQAACRRACAPCSCARKAGLGAGTPYAASNTAPALAHARRKGTALATHSICPVRLRLCTPNTGHVHEGTLETTKVAHSQVALTYSKTYNWGPSPNLGRRAHRDVGSCRVCSCINVVTIDMQICSKTKSQEMLHGRSCMC